MINEIEIEGKNLASEVTLKNGMVVQLERKEPDGTKSIHNMVIVDYVDHMVAIEQLMIGDKPTFGTIGDNYCVINKNAWPDTLGIDYEFGNKVVEIMPSLCLDLEDPVIIVVDTDENGINHKRI